MRADTRNEMGNAMNTVLQMVETGDVVEFELEGELVSALVLLAGEELLILDLCDGRTPVVARLDELPSLRRFDAEPVA